MGVAENRASKEVVSTKEGLLEKYNISIEKKAGKVEAFSSIEGAAGRAAGEETFMGSIIGTSPVMRSIFSIIKKLGKTSSSVLITGESGVGKELVARAVHKSMVNGERRPFVAINCGALPAGLMESELFGHEKGAFTGAHSKKTGKVKLAEGGTLFLDEIATMPLHLQVKLLRFLQERKFTPLGGNALINADIRIIAAANTNLQEAVSRGEFREDLFYRLNVVPIEVPPLRERGSDISRLAMFFLQKYAEKYSLNTGGISTGALRALEAYGWPGNVRELENIMERLVVLTPEKNLISKADLPQEIFSAPVVESEQEARVEFKEAVRQFERSYILNLLERTGWNRLETAHLMKVHRNTLLMKMKVLQIAGPDNAPLDPGKGSSHRETKRAC
ncbi:MAG: sigma-54 interaction domain-containing protein [Thermodesulfobacteriota bacterium]